MLAMGEESNNHPAQTGATGVHGETQTGGEGVGVVGSGHFT